MSEVLTAREGAVFTITLNRPDVFNAFNRALHAALHQALEEAADPAVRAVVITGAGRGFCAGQDLREFSELEGSGMEAALEATYHPTIRLIRGLEKPVIAAVNGPAAGAGLSLACACDVRVASTTASFVPGFVGIGLVPDSGGSLFLYRLLGYARAFEWMSSNQRLDAREAREWGLVSEVVSADEFEGRIVALAASWATLPTRAVGLDEAIVRPRPHRHARGAAGARGTTADSGRRDRRLRRRSERLPGEAGTELHRRLSGARPSREGAPMSEQLTSTVDPDGPPPHPIHLVVTDDLHRSRLTVFFRLLLVIPHLIVLTLWGIVIWFVVVIAWVVSIFTGRVPDGLRNFIAMFLRYLTHVYAYLFIAANPYPGFTGEPGYPVDVEIASGEKMSRLTIIFRIFLAIPPSSFSGCSATSRRSSPSSRGSGRSSRASSTRACATCSRTTCATTRRCSATSPC